MLKNGWFLRGLLLLCLGAAGCEADSDGGSDSQGAPEYAEQRADQGRRGWMPGSNPNEPPCSLIDCGPNKVCEAKPVQCVTEPCPAVATCVPVSDNGGRRNDVTCANVRCASGTRCVDLADGPACIPDLKCSAVLCAPNSRCVDTRNGPECVPDTTPTSRCATTLCGPNTTCVDTARGAECRPRQAPASCAATLCPVNTVCEESPSGARCITPPSCKNMRCGRGTHCEMVDVVCVRAPCHDQPMCVPDVDECARVRCGDGQRCVTKPIRECLVPPCGNAVQCVDI